MGIALDKKKGKALIKYEIIDGQKERHKEGNHRFLHPE